MSDLIIRQALPNDYPAFRAMEERAWAGSGVPVIPEDMFRTWIEVNPRYFLVAERSGRLYGHIYSQICDYDPLDITDKRSWSDITDSGYSVKSHSSKGDCVYTVSISAFGVGKYLMDKSIQFMSYDNKLRLAGACRMPGLSRYIKNHYQIYSEQTVHEYASKVVNSFINKEIKKDNITDPTLTPVLGYGLKFHRVLRDYFEVSHDKESQGWAAIVSYSRN